MVGSEGKEVSKDGMIDGLKSELTTRGHLFSMEVSLLSAMIA